MALADGFMVRVVMVRVVATGQRVVVGQRLRHARSRRRLLGPTYAMKMNQSRWRDQCLAWADEVWRPSSRDRLHSQLADPLATRVRQAVTGGRSCPPARMMGVGVTGPLAQ